MKNKSKNSLMKGLTSIREPVMINTEGGIEVKVYPPQPYKAKNFGWIDEDTDEYYGIFGQGKTKLDRHEEEW